MRFTKKGISLLLVLVLLICCLPTAEAAETRQATVLFTHDLHSHLLPAEDPDGTSYGGYARLMTVIRQQRELYPDAVLVDGGDFSMGSLFQTAFSTSAIELRMMGAMGYDATTFGNHEFDYLPTGLASMLHTAAACGDAVPPILDGNYYPAAEGENGYNADSQAVWEAYKAYGVKEYMLLERGGIYYAIFGIMGFDSHDCAPNSGHILQDPAESAQRIVDAAKAECMRLYGQEPLVICLSHSGTENGQGEDYELAKAVEGIHLIVSAHTHTTLTEPIQVENTYIVSAGEYGRYLGVVQMEMTADSDVELTDYTLIPINAAVAEDPETAALVEGFKKDVEDDYLSRYGLGFDEVVISNSYVFDTVPQVYATPHESTLCNVFSDAYRWAAEQTLGERVDVALTASGVIRDTIPMGDVTVSHIFNAASLGVGTEGELVHVYLTGADLKNALEVDASVQPLMRSAQLFCSGVEYSFNTNRMIFNKIDHAALRRDGGMTEPIRDDALYSIVTGMYMAQMLGSVEETSLGLLTIVPRNSQGEPIAIRDLKDHVIRDPEGTPLKEWFAIVSYLQQMDGTMDAAYGSADGRKVVYSSWNPMLLLRNANRFTWIALAAMAALLLATGMIIRYVIRRRRRKT